MINYMMNPFKGFLRATQRQQKENPVFTDVMDVVPKTYPKIVEEIHNEFHSASDKLLLQAKEILANMSITNEQKVEKLKSFGFNSAKEVLETEQQIIKRKLQEDISVAINDFKILFPNHKFITQEAVKVICAKYGLILGENRLYKGFVPAKNLNDIERFFNEHEDERYSYYMGYRYGMSRPILISKKQYESYQEDRKTRNQGIGMSIYISDTNYYRTNTHLFICAPKKDMNTDGYTLKDHILVRDVPDPIVLLPKTHGNGIEGYIILTAWGDEANDPEVINEALN